MSFSCSSSSTSGSVVSKLAHCLALPFLYPSGLTQILHSRPARGPRLRMLLQPSLSANGFETLFFNSLTSAGHCHKHRAKSLQACFFTPRRPFVSSKRRQVYGASPRRQQHTAADVAEQEEEGEKQNRTKEELMALVDQYSGDSYTDQLPLLELPNLYQPSDGPHLTISDKIEDEWPPPHNEWPADAETKTKIALLKEALRNISKDPEEIYELYRDLPRPRVPYLDAKTRHRLLRHLSVVKEKDEDSMIRYFSVVDDMKGTAIPLSTAEWNSAISFAARYVIRSTELEVEAALHMWREMEHVAGIKGNEATFNILYDVACKAGKFTLAEMIYKEMDARGFEYNRYHHVSRIHCCGLKADGHGAREAYKTLVEAGEMVDTVVLNATIAALIQSHEAHAAENVYERMKAMYMEDTGKELPPRDYKVAREITKTLMKMARFAKKDPSRREELQSHAIIAPDAHTYHILVNYFAVTAGELSKTARFLDEMKAFRIPPNSLLFLALFKGFSMHGGIRYTEWTEDRLESVWDAFIQALDDGVEDILMSKSVVIWALKAFAKCSGKSRTVETWEQIKERWNPGDADLDEVLSSLRTLINAPDMAEQRHDWLLGSKQ